MMTLDLQTLLLASGMVVAVCGMCFIMNTIVVKNDAAGRLWSTAFMTGILTTVSYAIWGGNPDAWWVIVIGNGSLVMSMGSMWSGARLFGGFSSRFWVVVVVTGIAAAAVVVEGPAGGAWAGGVVMLAGVSAFAGLAGAEMLRRRMRRNLNARLLATVMWGVSLYYAARTVVFLVANPESEVFLAYFGTEVTTFVTILFVIVASMSMSILRVERDSGGTISRPDVQAARWKGILPQPVFVAATTDRLERAAMRGQLSAVIAAEIDSLAEMNLAFGRAFGDEAIQKLASILRTELPATAQIGNRGGGRFAAILVGDEAIAATAVAERVRDALVDTPIDDSRGLRLSVSFGVATLEPGSGSAGELFARVDALVERAQEAGGNRLESPGVSSP